MSQGLTALTFWVLVHFLFIFGAIIVYGVQLTLIRFQKSLFTGCNTSPVKGSTWRNTTLLRRRRIARSVLGSSTRGWLASSPPSTSYSTLSTGQYASPVKARKWLTSLLCILYIYILLKFAQSYVHQDFYGPYNKFYNDQFCYNNIFTQIKSPNQLENACIICPRQ